MMGRVVISNHTDKTGRYDWLLLGLESRRKLGDVYWGTVDEAKVEAELRQGHLGLQERVELYSL